MRRSVPLIVALAIAVGTLSACSSGGESEKKAEKSAVSAQEAAAAKAKQLQEENLKFARIAAQARLDEKLEPISDPKMLGTAWQAETVESVNSSVAQVFVNDAISSNYPFLVAEEISNSELKEKVLPAIKKIMVSQTHALRDLSALGGYATASQLVTIIKSNYRVDGPMLATLNEIATRGGKMTAGDMWNLSTFVPPCSSEDRDLVKKLDLEVMCNSISDSLSVIDVDIDESGTRVWKTDPTSYMVAMYVDNNKAGAAFRLELPFVVPADSSENTQPVFRYTSDAILTEYQVLREKAEAERQKSRTLPESSRGGSRNKFGNGNSGNRDDAGGDTRRDDSRRDFERETQNPDGPRGSADANETTYRR